MNYRIISIGTLSAHPLWDESKDVRTGHATTTLVSTGEAHLLVDPSLPAQVLAARLDERSNFSPQDITHVFLTSFEPERRRGLPLFENARLFMHEPEIDAAREALRERLEEAERIADESMATFFREQLDLLGRVEVAPDKLLPGVDLFPLPGVTPGCCGLLLPLPGQTVLICGDAVATSEHVTEGKVLPGSVDVETAKESFREAIEIADVLIPGRDNIVLNPLRRTM